MARRTFRHPDTGHEVALLVEREVAVGNGEEPRWRVALYPNGMDASPVGLPQHVRTLGALRRQGAKEAH